MLWLLIIIYLFSILFPVGFLFLTSLKTTSEIYKLPINWIPREKVDVQNYYEAFIKRNFTQYTFNSFIIVAGVLLICFSLGSLAAYGFARYQFPGQNLLLLILIGARMVAPVALVIPFFVIFYRLNLMNTKIALILANTYMNLPFYILIVKQTMEQIPKDVLDSARVDGCSELKVFSRVVLPLSKAGLAAGGIFAFIFSWNEFLFASILTSTNFAKPLTVGITEFLGDRTISWGPLSAGGIIAMIPSLVFILIFQNYIIKGIMAGAVKE